MTDIELQPDVSEVIQEEAGEYITDIGVCVKSVTVPVRVQELPRKLATSQTRTVGTTAQRYLRADHWRASAKIVPIDGNILIAFNEASAQDDSTMAQWPMGEPYTHTAATDVWVKAVQNTVTVSVITERWATGE